MPEYLSPAVYIEEQDGVQPIEGVSTSTAGFVGVTVRGPVAGLPTLVTSFSEFERAFGGYFDFGPEFLGLNHLPHAVNGFFINGGKRLYISRVPGDTNGTATDTTPGGLVTRLATDTSASDLTHARLVTLRNLQADDHVQLIQVKNGISTSSPPLKITAYDRNTNIITFTPALGAGSVFQAQYTTVLKVLASPLTSIIINAADPGSWGNQITITPTQTTAVRTEVVAVVDAQDVQLRTTAGFYVGAWVEFDRGQHKVTGRVAAINGVIVSFDPSTLAAPLATHSLDPQGAATTTIASVCEFSLTVSYNGVTEQFRSLTLENIPGHFYKSIINNSSGLISIPDTSAPGGTDPNFFPAPDNGLNIALGKGSDGVKPVDQDFVGTDNGPGSRTGIQALIDIPEISIIAAPGVASQVVQQALIDQCELLKYRFAILDPNPKPEDLAPDLNDIQLQRDQYDTKYAAIYYPRLVISDPLTSLDINVPPSGHMAGIYARVDDSRGVQKAPANEVINGILGLEVIVNQAEQDILNPPPNNINVLRDFTHQGRGLRVWGARCITSLDEWKYVNVRRLFIFLEASIDAGTQWAVFEPNDQQLWARVTQSISNFLVTVWRDGALMGATQEQAFFVKCDQTTMTQDDIDNGRLIVLVGVAPVKPAEFVIIRIGQTVQAPSV